MQEQKKLKIDIIGKRVYYSTSKSVLEIICAFILFLGGGIGIGFLIRYCSSDIANVLPVIICAVVGVVIAVALSILGWVKLVINHNAPENTLAIREDDKLIIYEENGDKIYIDLQDIIQLKPKTKKQTIWTPYFYHTETFNYGKLYIRSCSNGEEHTDVVKDVYLPETVCLQLDNILKGTLYDED